MDRDEVYTAVLLQHGPPPWWEWSHREYTSYENFTSTFIKPMVRSSNPYRNLRAGNWLHAVEQSLRTVIIGWHEGWHDDEVREFVRWCRRQQMLGEQDGR